MNRIAVGLYSHSLQLPSGPTALGTFVVSTYHEVDGIPTWDLFSIHVARPFGAASVSPI
jgi:hypothetical protein